MFNLIDNTIKIGVNILIDIGCLLVIFFFLFIIFYFQGIEESHKSGKIASLIGVEGGHAIGTSLSVLRMFYHLGARYLTLTHTCNTPW